MTRSCLVLLTGLSLYLLAIGFATGVGSEGVRFDRRWGAALRRYGIAPVPHGDRAASGESGAVIDTNPIARGVVRLAPSLTQPAPRPSFMRAETQGAMSSIAMALTAIFTVFVGPFLIPRLVVLGE